MNEIELEIAKKNGRDYFEIKYEPKYYNPLPLLARKDLDGNEPAVVFVDGNRTAGKTTAYLIEALIDFYLNDRKFVVFHRIQSSLISMPYKYADILRVYPKLGAEMTTKWLQKDLINRIYIDGMHCGYSIWIGNEDLIKDFSPVFFDTYYLLFDEFQTESGKYLKNEVKKFTSILVSLSRGNGEAYRPTKCIMMGNPVSLMNPYYIHYGVYKRIRNDTKFLRGHGWVGEFVLNQYASDRLKESALYQAGDQKYMNYSTENVYLIDEKIFIKKPKGKSKYIFTIVHDGEEFGVRNYFDEGYVYVSKKADPSYPVKVTFKANDHNQNTVMLNHNSYLWKNIRDAYLSGMLRFDDAKTKNVVFDILAIDLYK